MKNPLDAAASDDNPALKTRRDLLKAAQFSQPLPPA